MRHMKCVTVAKAATGNKNVDPAGMIFLQIWFSVMSMMLFGAFGGKD